MEIFSSSLSYFMLLLLLVHCSHAATSTTTMLEGFEFWKSPALIKVGDSLVMKRKDLRNLYLFNDKRAFDLCLLSQATLIPKENSNNFKWHAKRPGIYYFCTKEEFTGSCQKGSEVEVRVIAPQPYPSFSPFPAPAPISGGEIPTFPSHRWPFPSHITPAAGPDAFPILPRSESPSPAPTGSPVSSTGIPFISSSPAVPIPTGETDTATIHPLPTPGSDESQVIGLAFSVRARQSSWILVVMVSALLFRL